MSRLRRIDWGSQIGALIAAAFFLAPTILLISVSFQGQGGGLSNYGTVLSNPFLPRFLLNSATVAVSTTAIVTLVAVMAGFSLSKLRPRGAGIILSAILLGLMIPTAVMVIPLFIQARDLGLFDTYIGLIGPYVAISVPFSLLMTKNFMDSMGNELLEAGRLDGCGDWRLLFQIVVPVVRPIVIVVGLWAFIGSWGEYFLASVFMKSVDMQMVTQAPTFYISQYQQDTGKVFASLVIISLPLMIIYLIGQRTFIDGLGAGSVK